MKVISMQNLVLFVPKLTEMDFIDINENEDVGLWVFAVELRILQRLLW